MQQHHIRYVYEHPVTGLLFYRRIVPAAIRSRIGDVHGFASKAKRKEFLKSLGTRDREEAAKRVAEIDRAVQEEIDRVMPKQLELFSG